MTFPWAKKIKQYSAHISVVLLILSTLYIGSVLFHDQKLLTTTYNHNEYKKKYENSQWQQSQNLAPIRVLDEWAIAHGTDGWGVFVDQNKDKINIQKLKQKIFDDIKNKSISDEELYTYAADLYIHGYNPILINPEVPPFGKYLIGLSIVIFQNQYYAALISGIAALVFIFLITKEVTKSIVAASIAVFLTTINSLFTDQIVSAQLDIFQLLLLLAFMFVYLKLQKKYEKLYLLCGGIVFGLFISTKIFFLSFFLLNGWLVLTYLLAKEPIKKVLLHLVIINAIGLITFILSYARYFTQGHTFREFMGVQKWIFLFYKQTSIDVSKLIGNYVLLILLNRWRVWSTGYPIVHYEHWSILWPFVFIGGIVSIFKQLKDKKHFFAPILIAFAGVYGVYLFFVPIFPRYLLLLFIPLNMLIACYFAKILQYGTKKA
jgi:hypothetical protein